MDYNLLKQAVMQKLAFSWKGKPILNFGLSGMKNTKGMKNALEQHKRARWGEKIKPTDYSKSALSGKPLRAGSPPLLENTKLPRPPTTKGDGSTASYYSNKLPHKRHLVSKSMRSFHNRRGPKPGLTEV